MLENLKQVLGKFVVVTFRDGDLLRGTLYKNVVGFEEVQDEFDLVTKDGLHYVFNYNSVSAVHSLNV